MRSAVHKAVCSPVRNPLDAREKHAIRAAMSAPSHLLGRLLARSAGVRDPRVRWRIDDGPWFDNALSTLDIEGPHLHLRIERATADDEQSRDEDDERRLETVLERRLA